MKVKELLSSEEKWCKGALARDERDKFVMPADKSAVKWCINGAICVCYPKTHWNYFIQIVSHHVGENSAGWNNDEVRTFEDIRRVVTELDI